MLLLNIILAPICIEEQDVVHFPGQRNVTICVSLETLTDHFENYGFEVRFVIQHGHLQFQVIAPTTPSSQG